MRAEALVLLGESELRLKRYATAYQAFQLAVEAPGQEPALRFRSLAGIGLVMEEQRQWAQAAKYYEEVAAKSPDTTLRNWAKERRSAVAAKLKPDPKPKSGTTPKSAAPGPKKSSAAPARRRSLVRRSLDRWHPDRGPARLRDRKRAAHARDRRSSCRRPR